MQILNSISSRKIIQVQKINNNSKHNTNTNTSTFASTSTSNKRNLNKLFQIPTKSKNLELHALNQATITSTLFAFSTIYVIPYYIMMIFYPRAKLTKTTIKSEILFIPLCLIYLYVLIQSWQPDTLNLMLPGDIKDGLKGFNPQYFPKLENISILFNRVITTASMWIHIITVNLFYSRYLYLNSKGFEYHLSSRILIFISFIFGPLAFAIKSIIKLFESKMNK